MSDSLHSSLCSSINLPTCSSSIFKDFDLCNTVAIVYPKYIRKFLNMLIHELEQLPPTDDIKYDITCKEDQLLVLSVTDSSGVLEVDLVIAILNKIDIHSISKKILSEEENERKIDIPTNDKITLLEGLVSHLVKKFNIDDTVVLDYISKNKTELKDMDESKDESKDKSKDELTDEKSSYVTLDISKLISNQPAIPERCHFIKPPIGCPGGLESQEKGGGWFHPPVIRFHHAPKCDCIHKTTDNQYQSIKTIIDYKADKRCNISGDKFFIQEFIKYTEMRLMKKDYNISSKVIVSPNNADINLISHTVKEIFRLGYMK